DHVGIFPLNDTELVNRLGELCKTDLDTAFTLTAVDDWPRACLEPSSSNFSPGSAPVPDFIQFGYGPDRCGAENGRMHPV
ncbi:unnamed protein product, partial [Cyprideis torosa]